MMTNQEEMIEVKTEAAAYFESDEEQIIIGEPVIEKLDLSKPETVFENLLHRKDEPAFENPDKYENQNSSGGEDERGAEDGEESEGGRVVVKLQPRVSSSKWNMEYFLQNHIFA